MKRLHYVYILKDENGIVRYVGKSKNYKGRIRDHFRRSSNLLVRQNINKDWTSDHTFSSYDEVETLKEEEKLIKKYRFQIFNIKNSGGITRKSTKITLTLKNIKTNELKHFKSQYDAAKFLNLHPSTISYLVIGKRKHISGIWTLEETDSKNIVINPRKTGFTVDRPKRYFKLYDNVSLQYVSFISNADCCKRLNTNSTTVTRLLDGRISSIKRGRYTTSPDSVSQYKKLSVKNIHTNKIEHYDTRADFAKKYGYSTSLVSYLTNRKIKTLKNTWILHE